MATVGVENIVKVYPDCRLIIFGSFVSTKIYLKHPNVEKIVIDSSREDGNRYKNLISLARSVGDVDIAFSFRKNITTKFLLFFV